MSDHQIVINEKLLRCFEFKCKFFLLSIAEQPFLLHPKQLKRGTGAWARDPIQALVRASLRILKAWFIPVPEERMRSNQFLNRCISLYVPRSVRPSWGFFSYTTHSRRCKSFLSIFNTRNWTHQTVTLLSSLPLRTFSRTKRAIASTCPLSPLVYWQESVLTPMWSSAKPQRKSPSGMRPLWSTETLPRDKSKMKFLSRMISPTLQKKTSSQFRRKTPWLASIIILWIVYKTKWISIYITIK